MKLENAKKIVEFLQAEDIEATLYEDYSGRGMFGTTTAAVVTDDPVDVGRAMGALCIKDSTSRDNMGLSMVIY